MMRRLPLFALLLLAAACTTTTPPSAARFKILQLNDVYKIEGLEGGNSGGLARVRTLRRHLESDGTPVIVLHGGDLLYPSVMSKYLEARPMVDVMNLLDGNAVKEDPRLVVGFGNHEFDNRTPDVLLQRLAESRFEWVATNTRRCNPACDQRFPATTDIRIFEDLGGTKVAVFGILYPQQKSYVRATDVIAAAADAVSVARRGGAKVVIAVTHQDMGQDVEMVQKVAGIDLVIGGHDHLYMQQRVGGTWITKADADAKSVIVYDVSVDRAGVHTTPLRVVLDTSIAKDGMVDARVQEWLAALSAKLGGNDTIATTKNLLEGVEPVVRGRESALGNLLTDVARAQMGTEVGMLNGGSIRINDNIPPGPITKYDMEGIFYFTNTLVAFRATGQQLLDVLRNAVSRADAGDGRFLQVSGVSFTYHPRDGAYVVNAEDVRVNGKPLDVKATYSIATIDYLYENGDEDGFALFTDANRPPKINTEREADFRATVESYLRKAGTVDVDVEGRIVRE
ncbi:MAG TPA: 5'-nucleotidase C-terminal domain-containing protein [Thermoanaerobaculia bacterium]|jgi:5'-nucleotidase|nr:5'-nucleotidase C-terminal domain-containing protein [Thermoanaerobaculia bacterium]